MNGLIFLALDRDRLMVRLDSIIAIDELGENDIDVRTGRLALGIPEGSVAKVMTERATFYTKTTYDELVATVREVTSHG